MSGPESSLQVTADQHTLAKYFLELTMIDYEMVHYPPSMVASAALALTLKILDAGEWVSLTSINASLQMKLDILELLILTPRG